MDHIEFSRTEIMNENRNKLNHFIETNENLKNNVSESDQFYMLMQLVNCARNNEINCSKNKSVEYINFVNYKWKLMISLTKNLWEITPSYKYKTVMQKLTSMNLWKSGLENINTLIATNNEYKAIKDKKEEKNRKKQEKLEKKEQERIKLTEMTKQLTKNTNMNDKYWYDEFDYDDTSDNETTIDDILEKDRKYYKYHGSSFERNDDDFFEFIYEGDSIK